MTRWHEIAAWRLFAGLAIVFMLTPLAILIVFCFSESALLSFPIKGWTFDWFVKLAARSEFWKALENSVVVTGTVGVVSTAIGTMTAMALARAKSKYALGYMALLTVPVMVPPLMLGVLLLTYYTSWLDIRLGLHTVVLSHLVFTQPFVVLIINARMSGFNYAALDSARDLGASPVTAFFTITLPVIQPSIIGAALIAMALSLDDFLVSFFTIGGGNTLPIFMWGMLRKGVDPTINIVAVMLMLLSIGVSLIGLRVTRYRS